MFGDLVTAACPDWPVHFRAGKSVVDRIKLGMAIAGLTVLTGCIGVVDDGGYSGGEVGWWGGWWGGGGGYDRGHDVQTYSARGATSREAAHGGGGGQAKGADHAQAKGGGGGQAKGDDKH